MIYKTEFMSAHVPLLVNLLALYLCAKLLLLGLIQNIPNFETQFKSAATEDLVTSSHTNPEIGRFSPIFLDFLQIRFNFVALVHLSVNLVRPINSILKSFPFLLYS